MALANTTEGASGKRRFSEALFLRFDAMGIRPARRKKAFTGGCAGEDRIFKKDRKGGLRL
ncbi:MAG: hypothetical protein DBY36_08925 [Clostridiales bacterium]|nr:MAG: hypothetical protein DBY36_08925 [Clostridiales bacterium]